MYTRMGDSLCFTAWCFTVVYVNSLLYKCLTERWFTVSSTCDDQSPEWLIVIISCSISLYFLPPRVSHIFGNPSRPDMFHLCLVTSVLCVCLCFCFCSVPPSFPESSAASVCRLDPASLHHLPALVYICTCLHTVHIVIHSRLSFICSVLTHNWG